MLLIVTSTRHSIQQLFNIKQEKKLRSLTGRGKLGLTEHLQFVVKFREKAQTMIDPADIAANPAPPKSPKPDRERGGSNSGSGQVNFGKPKRYEECRVCGQLECQGGTTGTGLYENHTGIYVTGCPQFQAMSTDQRRDICMKAKICVKCSDPKVIYTARHRNERKVSDKKKFSFTFSQYRSCLYHS